MQESPKNIPLGNLPKKYEACYVFNEYIGKIWHFVSNIKNIEQIFTDTHINDVLSESPFILKLKLAVDEISSLECNKKIIWRIQGQISPTLLLCSFSLLSNTIDNTTLLTLSLIVKNPNQTKELHQKIIEGSNTLVKELINKIENLLKQNPSIDYVYQSIEIKCPIELAWNYITKFVFLEGKENVKDIKFEGNSESVGGKVKWSEVDDEGNEEKISCVISTYNKNPLRKKWAFGIHPLDGALQSQEAKFVFISLSKEVTFFSYYHKFNDAVGKYELFCLKEKKKKELEQYKEYLEKNFDSKRKN